MPFKPGQSGNPGGKPSIVKALAACGTDSAKLTAEVIERLIDAVRTLDPGDKFEGASWRFAAQQLLDRMMGKPKETVEFKSDLSDDEYMAELAEIAREHVRSLPAEERVKLLTDPAPTDTIQ